MKDCDVISILVMEFLVIGFELIPSFVASFNKVAVDVERWKLTKLSSPNLFIMHVLIYSAYMNTLLYISSTLK